jgi:hypothetical protein
MKTEIALLPAVIVAVIYLGGLFMLSLYIIESLSTLTMEAHFISEGIETPF